MLHILGFIALVALAALFIVINSLLKAVGLIKPPPIVPSGIDIGEKAFRTVGRDTPSAQRHLEALDKMSVLIDDHNGEVWRVLDCKPHYDNTYKFLLLRVA